jgi:ribosomal protein S12 methylthiotransferase
MTGSPGRIGFVSLGCPKALVDSERILTGLRASGYEISNSYQDSDLIVINTCGFIEDAVAESMEAIGDAMQENGKVIVTGCLGARGDDIMQEFPQVLAVTGPDSADDVLAAVQQHLPRETGVFTSLISEQRVQLTPPHYAYLKISEGCNHHCTFCIIPSMRGRLRSRPVEQVLDEAQRLVQTGVRELLVISQDTSAYGVDTRYQSGFWQNRPVKTRLTELCRELAELEAWVRLHYVYPYPHVDELIPLMAEGHLLPYLDIPMQHSHPTVLRAMKRPADSENMLQRIRSWREIRPDISIRSTFIVGFPGETDEEFNHLLDFLEQAELDRVGCFRYSDVEGAAANNLPGKVDDDTSQERYERLMWLQQQISRERLAKRIGSRIQVIIDEVTEDGVTGRTMYDAPEIDGVASVISSEELAPGDIIEAVITETDDYDVTVETI